jgi:hypothetical protein
VIRTVARTNVYNRGQGESGAEEMKREGGERREAKCRVCVRCVLQKSCTGIMHTQRHVEPRFL